MVLQALYPGTFDPITNGHLDIIARAMAVTDTLVIGIAGDTNKQTMFDIVQRTRLVQSVVSELDYGNRIVVTPFNGLLIHFANEVGATVLVRGLRAVSDFEYEFQMASMNKKIASTIETMFLMAADTNQFISSRLVKEIHALNGDVSQFVPTIVLKAMDDKIKYL